MIGALNHEINGAFSDSMLARYQHLERRPGVFWRVNMRRYMARRPDVIRQAVAEYFGLSAALVVRVAQPTSGSYVIDGFAEEGAYRGAYFPGQAFSLGFDGPPPDDFSHWLVNDRRVDDTSVRLTIEGRQRIVPVFNAR